MNTNTEAITLEAAGVPEARPLRRDAERNRRLIIGAAKVVFAQRGLEASLDDVAKEAGLGVGTVYRRFPNRDALIDALHDDMVASIMGIIDESMALPRAWDGLVHFMNSMLESQGRDKALRDTMLSRQKSIFNECGEVDQDFVRAKLEPALKDLLERAQRDGDLRRDVTVTDFGVLLVAAVSMVEFTAPAAPQAWRRHVSIILDGLRARPEGETIEFTDAPLDDEQIDVCMLGWKYGSRETPRSRTRPS